MIISNSCVLIVQIASYAGNEKLLTLLLERSANPDLQVIKSHGVMIMGVEHFSQSLI